LTTAFLAASVRAQQSGPLQPGPERDLLIVTVDGKYGYIDHAGRMVIQPGTFDFAWQFSEGRAAAWLNGQVGFIDRTGKFVIAPRFEYTKPFHEGLAEVQLGGLWGFVTTDGELAIAAVRGDGSVFGRSCPWCALTDAGGT
jgi:WG containing repeat